LKAEEGGSVFSRRQQVIWILALIGLLTPYVGLMVVGGYALWEKGWFFIYGGITAGITTLVYGLASYLRGKRGLKDIRPLEYECPQSWPPQERAAWEKVERLAQEATEGKIPVNTVQDLRALIERLIQEIAHHYHPHHEDAYLDVPLPQLLKIVEKVAQEVRQVVQSQVPGSHILTIRDWKNMKDMYDVVKPLYETLYTVYRVGTLPISIPNALWREIRRYAVGQVFDLSKKEATESLISYVIHRMGFYLIELYSGRVILDESDFEKTRLAAEQAELRSAEPDVDDVPPEFIRIVIAGQLKAGKSSLVNALRGTWQAQTDVLPCTGDVQYYLMRPSTESSGTECRPVLPGLLMLVDTPGYDSPGQGSLSRPLRAEIEKADLIVLVCSARMASRKADHDFLGSVRQFFQEHPRWKMPPVIVVGSFIDELRPRHEWNPPYRWGSSQKLENLSPKEQAIQQFLEVLRRDLELGSQEPVIPVCTHPERVWNIAEGLIPVIAEKWDEARGVRDNRHVQSHQRKRYRLIPQQIKNAARLATRLTFKKIGLA